MDIVNTQNLRRTVLAIAWPAVLRTFLNMVVQMVDMIMVGSLGAISIAAVGLGNQVFFFSVAIVQAFSIGTAAIVAQAVGKRDLETAKRVAAQSLGAVLLTTFLLSTIAVIYAKQIVWGLVYFMPEKDLKLISLGSQYLGIISISISLRFSIIIVNAVFQGAGNSRTPLYLMASTNLINVLGNYLLIFGVGPFPKLGVQGAALATCAAGLITGAVGITLLFTRFSPVRLDFDLKELFFFKKRVLLQVLNVGIPSAVEQLGIHVSNIIYSMTVATLGSLAIAAHQILHNAYTMTYLPGIGFAVTATTLVGQFLGADKKERALESGLETTRLALLIMSAVGILFFFFPQTVIGIFTDDAQVFALGKIPLMLLAFGQPAIACVTALTGGLRGAGDTLWAMYLTLFSMFCLRLLLTFIFMRAGWGLTGIWLAALVEFYFRGFFVLRRFRSIIPRVESLLGTQALEGTSDV
ncbi:MAG: MATE family efflux transporter [Firmicutes bacterium]|nr:MATE family efflux transporter [Bacillota bacterium]